MGITWPSSSYLGVGVDHRSCRCRENIEYRVYRNGFSVRSRLITQMVGIQRHHTIAHVNSD